MLLSVVLTFFPSASWRCAHPPKLLRRFRSHTSIAWLALIRRHARLVDGKPYSRKAVGATSLGNLQLHGKSLAIHAHTYEYNAMVMNRTNTFSPIMAVCLCVHKRYRSFEIISRKKKQSFSEGQKTRISSFIRAMKILWLLLNREERIWCGQTTNGNV